MTGVLSEISFTIPGTPVSANASRAPKAVKVSRPNAQAVYRGRMYKASNAATYQTKVYGLAMQMAMSSAWKRPYYVAVTLHVYNCRQDLDNLPKCILDGMQGVFYQNDSRVKRLLVIPYWVKKGKPRVVVTINPIDYAEALSRGYTIPKPFR